MYNEESKLLGTQVLLEVKVIENQEYYNYKKIQNTYFYSFKMIFFWYIEKKRITNTCFSSMCI